jgi:hypothetical protein
MQEAAPTEAAGVEHPGVSAFLTGMAPMHEEIQQIEELFVRLSDRVQPITDRVANLEEPPMEVWTAERNSRVQQR